MENLSIDQINEYIAALGSNIRVATSRFEQINASNEAQYKVKLDASDEQEHSVSIRRLSDGNLRADIACLV
jgi:uncharacterized membrane protein|tara:strand:- start:2066 stop:2278 length:213 start_codon:yes stop_codon:yes gene_type:complete